MYNKMFSLNVVNFQRKNKRSLPWAEELATFSDSLPKRAPEKFGEYTDVFNLTDGSTARKSL
jgi:hypothetical protein